MATWHDHFTEEQADLIKQSPLFFIATVDPGLQAGPNGEGAINMSPKGGVPLIVVGPNKVAYLDSAGSGNGTARHTDNGSPTTIMVCSFEKENAGNVRLFGHGMAVPFEESSLSEKVLKHQATDLNLPQPEVIEIDVAKTSTSCGCGVTKPVNSLTFYW
ncbi:MAG TPA: hypothetical protein EYM38_00600 [Dehalococcoidia bacterium]|nr:hypothetical protein [Dehalococcoidia bacterium]